ncbi:MAG: sigma-54 interaction domain-containing protein [Desulfovibrionaceae bacterium]
MTEQELNLYIKDILNTMNDGLFVTRTDGTVMMVNEAFLRMTGYTRAEAMDRPCSFLDCDVCLRTRKEGRAHWCRLFESKKELMRSCRIRRKDGTYLHVIKNASLLHDENGAVLGAVETLTDISELDRRDRKIEELSRRLDEDQDFHGMIGRSPAMARLYDLLERAAGSDAPVILFGESGTGKELAAAAIHELGPRADGPFVRINCAAFNEALLESEIFGHVKGAFTGAFRHRTGRFEEAGGGGVLLDEIGDVPLSIQVKLLRVLETRTFERVGDSRPIPLDARIITATNQDLRAKVAQGLFREDFLFRINVIPIHLPPLRERREDIPALADHFIRRLNRETGRDVHGFSPAAMQAAMRYPWPGNIRELRSAIEYAFVVCDGAAIAPEHLPPQVGGADICAGRLPAAQNTTPAWAQAHGPASTQGTVATSTPAPAQGPAQGRSTGRMAREREELVAALRRNGGNQSAAARELGVSRVTVLNRMRKHGVTVQAVVDGTMAQGEGGPGEG